MSNQIFKKLVPIETFYSFLEKICEKDTTQGFYLFNISAYKKILYYSYHTDFLNELTEYYHTSKRFYLERTFTYNSIVTILRQISKSYHLTILSNTKYVDSNYVIEYSIPIFMSATKTNDNKTIEETT